VAPSHAAFEPTDGWPAGQRTVVETDRASWEGGVAALATQLPG
jgi:hypothetical protein